MQQTRCSGAIIVKDDLYLFGKRSPLKARPGLWDVFGGHAENGETADQTLVRELQEELGIIPASFRLFAEEEVRDGSGTLLYSLFFVTGWLNTPQNTGDEHTQIGWYTRTGLSRLELASRRYLDLIDAWLAGGR